MALYNYKNRHLIVTFFAIISFNLVDVHSQPSIINDSLKIKDNDLKSTFIDQIIQIPFANRIERKYITSSVTSVSGEKLKKTKLTAAHKKFPFNALVEVTNLANRRSVIVRINDRGPYKKGRVIDLSEAAAKKLNLKKIGLVKVKIKLVGFENELMLIPYQKLALESTPKFSRNFYQKSRLKYKTHYKMKKNVKNKKYINKKYYKR